MRGETSIFVCSDGCVVGPAGDTDAYAGRDDDGVKTSTPSIQLI